MQSAENGPQDGSTNSQVLNAKNYKNCQILPNLVPVPTTLQAVQLEKEAAIDEQWWT